MTQHKWAKEIIAFVEGKEVHTRYIGGEYWYKVTRLPTFTQNNVEFRIAPPNPKYRVALLKHKEGDLFVSIVCTHVKEDMYSALPNFVRWLSDWVEYEV